MIYFLLTVIAILLLIIAYKVAPDPFDAIYDWIALNISNIFWAVFAITIFIIAVYMGSQG